MELFFCIAHLVKPPHYLFHPRLLAAVSSWRLDCW